MSNANCLLLPNTIMAISSELSKMVEIPTLNAYLGTLLSSFPKNLQFALMVLSTNSTFLVFEFLDDPASLNAK